MHQRLHPSATPILDPSVPIPTSSLTQHLIRVHTTALTADELNWPETFARSLPIWGHDVCGTIIFNPANNTSKVRIGDYIYGLTSFSHDGTAVEYTVAEPEELAPKPTTMSAAKVGSMPLSALTVWQALFVHARMQANENVLVPGGLGDVGVIAVQLARARGILVTATCRVRNVGFVKWLGADRVFDYAQGGGKVERAVRCDA